MATIIQKPDTLSLSRNLKELIISTSSEISLQLLKGDSLLLEETYLPDVNNRVHVDLADIVTSTLSLTMPSGDAVSTSQSSVYSDFTVKVDGTSVAEFTAVRSGVERFSDTAANFLTANWLTWQPQVKEVLHDQPEWLTYYPASGSCACYARFYYTDGTSGEKKVCDVSQCVSINTRFSKLWALDESGKERYGVIDVYIKDAQGLRLTYVQRYVLCSQGALDEVYLCENSLGGLDTFRFYGDRKLVPEIGYTSLLLDNSYTAADPDLSRKWSQNTGMLTGRECEWCWELFRSSAAYHLYRGAILPIVLDASSVEKSAMSVLAAYSFDYRYASDLGLLNVPRSDNMPDVVEISGPDAEVFFLTPRLNEFPSAVLSDDLIIPVQSPYEESWYTLSVGGLKSALLSSVETIYGPMWHVHDNLQVLNLLSVDEKGNLLYNGLAVGSGIVGAHDHHGETIRPEKIIVGDVEITCVDGRLHVSSTVTSDGDFVAYGDEEGGEAGGGLDVARLWEELKAEDASKVIDVSHIPGSVVLQDELTEILDDYPLVTEMNTALAGKADKDWVEEELAKYVTISTDQNVTGVKTFTNGIKIGGITLSAIDGRLHVSSTVTSDGDFVAFGDDEGGTAGGGLDVARLWEELEAEGTEQIHASHLSDALTGYATQSDLDGRINDLINGAPAAYDTLKEIADVLKGNVDSIGDILTALGGKADKATTLEGYGIADAYTDAEVDSLLADYVTLAGSQNVTGVKTFTNGIKIGTVGITCVNGRLHFSATATSDGDFVAFGDEEGSGGSGGLDVERMWEELEADDSSKVIDVSHIPALVSLAGNLPWSRISGIPSWIGSSKPLYTWSEIGDKPTTFTPAAHNHPLSQISGLNSSWAALLEVAPSDCVIRWPEISEVTGLQDVLDSKWEWDAVKVADVKVNNAVAADRLATARRINGTSFDGTSDIVTARWGAARTVTIWDFYDVNKQASQGIDGSADFVLKLPQSIKVKTLNIDGVTLSVVDGRLHISHTVTSGGDFVAFGDEEGGTGSGGLDVERMWEELGGSVSSKVIDLSHIPAIPTSKITGLDNALASYATRTWVQQQGYLTSVSKATSSAYGGIKIGYPESGKNYPVELDSSGRAYVSVPWVNTTYSLSSFGITATAEEINKLDGVGTLLHSGNYTSYTVTKTGGGASGTWGINISGNAATADISNYLFLNPNNGTHASQNDAVPANGRFAIYDVNAATTAGGNDGYIMAFRWPSGNFVTQVFLDADNTGIMALRHRSNSNVWTDWSRILHSSNIGSYALTPSNYASTLDSRYVNVSGDTMTGPLRFVANGNRYLTLSDSGLRWDFSDTTGGHANEWLYVTEPDGSGYTGMGVYGTQDGLNYIYLGGSYTAPWVVLRPSGNVGIGVTSPSCRLHVSGNAYVNGIVYAASSFSLASNAGRFVFDSSSDATWLQGMAGKNMAISAMNAGTLPKLSLYADLVQANHDLAVSGSVKIGSITLSDSGGRLHVSSTVSSDGDFVAFGNEEGSGGSGGLDVERMWEELGGTTASKVISIAHIPAIPTSKITGLDNALASYATRTWVQQQGYLTSVSLATISDLHSSWDAVLKVEPTKYVTRWPTASEVGALTQTSADSRYAIQANDNNLISHSNEFNVIPAGFSNVVWFNFRAKGGTGRISQYIFGRGSAVGGEYAELLGSNFIADDGAGFVKRMHADTSNFETGPVWDNAAGTSHLAAIGYWNTPQKVFINPCYNEVTDAWMDAVGKHNFVVGKNFLTYNTYPILHSGNIGSYALTPSNYASTLDSRYVKKAGDTMGQLILTASADDILIFNDPDGEKYFRIKAKANGTDWGGLVLDGRSSVQNLYLGTTTDGYKVWHSGNDGSGSGLDADLLDGTHKSGLLTALTSNETTNLSLTVGGTTKAIGKLYAMQAERILVEDSRSAVDIPYSGGKGVYAAFKYNSTDGFSNGGTYHAIIYINPWNDNSGGLCTQLAFGDNGTVGLRKSSGSSWGSWRALAFTDSNVASATKLQTSRTLWGRPFDGTGNVSGDMTGVGSITGATFGIAGSVGQMFLYNNTSKNDKRLTLYPQSNYAAIYNIAADGSAVSDLVLGNNSNALYYDASANRWGIGTASPAYKLDVSGMIRATSGIIIGSMDDYGWYIGTGTRISAGISVARGVNVGSLLVSSAWADYTKVPTNGIYSKGNILSAGNIIAYSSSSRLVKDILPKRTTFSQRLNALGSVVDYRYNNVLKRDKDAHIGLVYENVRDAMPGMCHTHEGYGALNYLDTDYINLIAGAVQEHTDEIAHLKNKVASLEAEVTRLRRGLAA